MNSGSPTLTLLARSLTLDEARLRQIVAWYEAENANEELAVFLVRQRIFAPAAPIMLDLLDRGLIRRSELVFTSCGVQRLASYLSTGSLPPSDSSRDLFPESEVETAHRTDEVLIGIVAGSSPFSAADTPRLVAWWDRRCAENRNLDLLGYLEDEEILAPAAPILLRLVMTGVTRQIDSTRFFRPFGPTVLRQRILDDEAEETRKHSLNPIRLIGSRLGTYRIESLIRADGDLWHYAAVEESSNRKAKAVVLPPGVPADSPAFVQFERTIHLALKLTHPVCDPELTTGRIDDDRWYALPVPPGKTLESILGSLESWTVPEAVRLAQKIVDGLAFAHQVDCPHRNLKADQVWIADKTSVRLTGFCFDNGVSEDVNAIEADLDAVGAILQQLTQDEGSEIPLHVKQVIARLRGLDGQNPFASISEAGEALGLVVELLGHPETDQFRVTDATEEAPALRKQYVSPVTAPTPVPLGPGSVLGKVLILGEAGQGASGTVYKGLHQTLNIPVAVKIFRFEEFNGEPEILRQFQSEARLLARLNHRNVVRIWDFEDDPVCPYLVMEYVEGLNVAELIAQSGMIQPDRVVRIVLQVAAGLQAAWDLGIVHRDVKPGNILLTRNDLSAKLADLGLAMVRKGGAAEYCTGTPIDGIAGTAAYMAPEQANGDPATIDFRADIYALGCTMYHMLTGRLPFVGRSRMELILKHATETPLEPRELVSGLHPSLSDLVMRMVARNPADRFSSYTDLIAALEAVGPLVASSYNPVDSQVLRPDSSSTTKKAGSIWSRFFGVMRRS